MPIERYVGGGSYDGDSIPTQQATPTLRKAKLNRVQQDTPNVPLSCYEFTHEKVIDGEKVWFYQFVKTMTTIEAMEWKGDSTGD